MWGIDEEFMFYNGKVIVYNDLMRVLMILLIYLMILLLLLN